MKDHKRYKNLEKLLEGVVLENFHRLDEKLDNKDYSKNTKKYSEDNLNHWMDGYNREIDNIKLKVTRGIIPGVVVDNKYYPDKNLVGKTFSEVKESYIKSSKQIKYPKKRILDRIVNGTITGLRAPAYFGGIAFAGVVAGTLGALDYMSGKRLRKIPLSEDVATMGTIFALGVVPVTGAVIGVSTVAGGLYMLNPALGIGYGALAVGSLFYNEDRGDHETHNQYSKSMEGNLFLEHFEKGFYEPISNDIEKFLNYK